MNENIKYAVKALESYNYWQIEDLSMRLEGLPEEERIEICEWLIENRPDLWEYFCEVNY